MSYTTVQFSLHGTVGVVALARPRRRNALNQTALDEIAELLAKLESDDAVRALVITGDENAFSSGQDIKEEEPPGYLDAFNAVMARIEQFPKPVVAAIAGWCIAGGLEMALCCDLRIATPDAKIGDFHVRINSIGGGGATVRLPRLIGIAAAKRLIYTGEVIDGEAALGLGLVDEVRAFGEHLQAAITLAGLMAPFNPLTFSYAKRAIGECAELPLGQAIARSVELQRDLQARLAQDGRADEPRLGR